MTMTTLERRAGKAARLEEKLAAAIQRGDYGPDSAIPSLRELARDYGVHYNTAQAVVKRLSARGLVTRIKRRGVFVAEHATAAHPLSIEKDRAREAPRITTLGVMCIQTLAMDRRTHDHEFVRSLETLAASTESRVFHYYLDPPALAEPAELADRCVREGVDGVIIVGVRDTEPLGPVVMQLQKRNIPAVVCPLGRQSIAATVSVPLIDGDDRLSGVAAAQHLFDLGHRDMAMVTYDRRRPYIEQRIAGFLAVCDLHQLPTEGRIIRLPVEDMRPEEYRRIGFDAFSRIDPAVTGVFCINDSVAAGLIDAASAAGRVIGRDLSVVGHDNDEAYHDKQITTIILPIAQLSRKAWELLGRPHTSDSAEQAERIYLKSHLVWRRTSGAVRNNATQHGQLR